MHPIRYLRTGLVLAALWPGLPGPAAALEPRDACDAVAARVAAETGVPADVLRAISLTETGRRIDGATRSWPWTVNMEGAGHWFDTRDEALEFATRNFDRGARSFDIGCFQINYRWHGENFASVAEMFDPLANASYAARFLSDLHAELGDWSKAAGAYHSRTEVHAARYRKRFDGYRLAQDGTAPPAYDGGAAAGGAVIARANFYPLLQATEAPRALASLVPQVGAATPFLTQTARALR